MLQLVDTTYCRSNQRIDIIVRVCVRVKRDPNARAQQNRTVDGGFRPFVVVVASSSFVLKNQHSGDKTKGNARVARARARAYVCALDAMGYVIVPSRSAFARARALVFFFLPFFFFLAARSALRVRLRMAKLSQRTTRLTSEKRDIEPRQK